MGKSRPKWKMIKTYYRLTKPGIIYGNAINIVAGFFLASRSGIDWLLLASTLVGLSLIIACASVINNYIDRDIDAHMERTKNRAMVVGDVSDKNALIFAAVLGVGGVVVLAVFTNWLALAIAILGVLLYAGLYTCIKRYSHFATEVGSIAGAIPPLVGYVSVTGVVDLGGIILFLILMLWQMPHFFAISIYRRDEYAAAKVPVLSITHGVARAKIHILLYTIAFILAVFALPYYGFVGPLYVLIMAVVCAVWLLLALKGFFATDNKKWARQMFFFSLIVVLLLCAALILQR